MNNKELIDHLCNLPTPTPCGRAIQRLRKLPEDLPVEKIQVGYGKGQVWFGNVVWLACRLGLVHSFVEEELNSLTPGSDQHARVRRLLKDIKLKGQTHPLDIARAVYVEIDESKVDAWAAQLGPKVTAALEAQA